MTHYLGFLCELCYIIFSRAQWTPEQCNKISVFWIENFCNSVLCNVCKPMSHWHLSGTQQQTFAFRRAISLHTLTRTPSCLHPLISFCWDRTPPSLILFHSDRITPKKATLAMSHIILRHKSTKVVPAILCCLIFYSAV